MGIDWSRLTAMERSELVRLEKANNKSTGYGGGGYLPEDCSECPACEQPHLGSGLCLPCLSRLILLADKTDEKKRHEGRGRDVTLLSGLTT